MGIDLIAFPLRADPTDVASGMIVRLGVLSLVAAPLALTGIWAYTRYRINRTSYEASMRALGESGPDPERTGSLATPSAGGG